jgi:hypothetical protein
MATLDRSYGCLLRHPYSVGGLYLCFVASAHPLSAAHCRDLLLIVAQTIRRPSRCARFTLAPLQNLNENLAGEALVFALSGNHSPSEGARLLKKGTSTCHSKSDRSKSARQLLSASPLQCLPSRSVRRLPRRQMATSTQSRIEFIVSALFTRPSDGQLIGRGTTSCTTFLRTRSGCRVTRSCRGSGFWVHRAICRRAPAPIRTALTKHLC